MPEGVTLAITCWPWTCYMSLPLTCRGHVPTGGPGLGTRTVAGSSASRCSTLCHSWARHPYRCSSRVLSSSYTPVSPTSHALGSCSLWGLAHPPSLVPFSPFHVQGPAPGHGCIPLCHLPLPTHSVSTRSDRADQKPAHPLGIPQWLCMTFSKKSEENISPTQSWSRNGLLARTPPISLPADCVSVWRGHAFSTLGTQVTGAGRGQGKAGERRLCTGARPVPGNTPQSVLEKPHFCSHFLSWHLKLNTTPAIKLVSIFAPSYFLTVDFTA